MKKTIKSILNLIVIGSAFFVILTILVTISGFWIKYMKWWWNLLDL